MPYYARARVQAEGLVLEEPQALPVGSRFEGYSIPAPPPFRPPFRPMETEEAKRRFGEEVVAATARRGIDLDAIDWTEDVELRDDEFDDLSWYSVIPNLDREEPCAQWLPLFAHLLRMVEEGGDFGSHLSTIGVCVPSGVREAPASQILLAQILLMRVQEAIVRSPYVPISELSEAFHELYATNAECLRALERATA